MKKKSSVEQLMEALSENQFEDSKKDKKQDKKIKEDSKKDIEEDAEGEMPTSKKLGGLLNTSGINVIYLLKPKNK